MLRNTKAKVHSATSAKHWRRFHATQKPNFFASHHGKGPSDSESAVIKQHMTRAVKAGTAAVASAEEMLHFCKELVS